MVFYTFFQQIIVCHLCLTKNQNIAFSLYMHAECSKALKISGCLSRPRWWGLGQSLALQTVFHHWWTVLTKTGTSTSSHVKVFAVLVFMRWRGSRLFPVHLSFKRSYVTGYSIDQLVQTSLKIVTVISVSTAVPSQGSWHGQRSGHEEVFWLHEQTVTSMYLFD